MPAAAPKSHVPHLSSPRRPRRSSVRPRTSVKVLIKPSNQTMRSARPVTPKRGRPGALKSVEHDVHSASSPQRDSSTQGTEHNAAKPYKPRVRVISTAMFMTRSQSPGGSTTTAYDPDEDEMNQPCPSPVVGDSWCNENLRVRYTKLPSLKESRDWRRSVEARLMKGHGDVVENPMSTQPARISLRDRGCAASAPEENQSQVYEAQSEKMSTPTDEVESIIGGKGLCSTPSMPNLSGLRPRHSIKQSLAARHWLQRNGYTSPAAAFQGSNGVKQDPARRRILLPHRMRRQLAPKSLGTLRSDAKDDNQETRVDLEIPPRTTDDRADDGTKEGLEPWQTARGVRVFHRESMNFGDFRRDVERGWQSVVQDGIPDAQQELSKVTPKLEPAFEEASHDKVKFATPRGSPIKALTTGRQGAQKRQAIANRVCTDEYGSLQAQSGQTGIIVDNSSMQSARIVDLQKASSTKSPPLPGPRTSSRLAMGMLCLPFQQFGSTSSSVPEKSSTQSDTFSPLRKGSTLRRQAAGMDLRSRMPSITSSLVSPTFGAPAATSTDTLRIIEAQAYSDPMKSSLDPRLDAGPASVRSDRPLGDPPERPLPEIPTNHDRIVADRLCAGSRASSHSGCHSHSFSLVPPHRRKSSLTPSRVMIRAGDDIPRTGISASGTFNGFNFVGSTPLHASDLVSASSQQPLALSQSHSRLSRRGLNGRANRVHAIKKRDVASSIYGARGHYRHHRRISEENEEDPESTDQLEKFPAVPASRPPSGGRSHSRSTSRQHSRPQSGASQRQSHNRTSSDHWHAQANKLTIQVLAQSKIMVWADTNPVTTMFRAGALSPSPSMTSMTRSPTRNGKVSALKDSRHGVNTLLTSSSLPKLTLPQPTGGTQTPPSSAISADGATEGAGLRTTASSPARRAIAKPRQQRGHSSLGKKTEFASSCPAPAPAVETPVDRHSICSEIEKIGAYWEQLEAERSRQQHKIERLERMLAMALRREYWMETRASAHGDVNGNAETGRWRGLTGVTRYDRRRDQESCEVPPVSSSAGRKIVVGEGKGRPVSDASQVSTTLSADTDTSAKSRLSAACSAGDWQVTGNAECVGEGANGEEKRLSNAVTMTNIENIDGMLRELRLSRSMGSVPVGELIGGGLRRAAVRRDEKGLVLDCW